jgi:phage terminase large subunit
MTEETLGMELVISSSFFPLLEETKRYLVLCGGAGSGKTEFAARKLFIRGMREGRHRFLVLRKVRSRVRESVLAVFKTMLDEIGMAYEFNKTDRTIIFRNPAGDLVEILFDGLDDPEKIKSIKGITGIWLEETTEFTKQDFLQLDLRLREPGPGYHQIILTFNPDELQAPWLKEMFFDSIKPDARVHNSTIDDNPIREVRDKYRARLADLKGQDETMYSIYGLGKWAVAKGRIYNWDVVVAPPAHYDEIFYGGDFGYSVNPSACIRIWRLGNNDFWLQEVVYQDELTNPDLGDKMAEGGVAGTDDVYFDSSEPKSIDELCDTGLNIKPAEKGPDSVRAGIIFLKSKRIHIVAGSENIIRESKRYKWRVDKNGNPLPEPVKFDDHAMDAVRYGIYTHMRAAGAAYVCQGGEVY